MARHKAGGGMRVIATLGAAEQREARPGERIGMAAGILEQERHQRVGDEVPGVLGEIGQQQDGARINGAGAGDQRHIGPAGESGGERGLVAPAHQPPRRGSPVSVFSFHHIFSKQMTFFRN